MVEIFIDSFNERPLYEKKGKKNHFYSFIYTKRLYEKNKLYTDKTKMKKRREEKIENLK